MESKGITYTPTWGLNLIAQNDSIPFGTKISALHAALIQKINAVYLTGEVSGVMVSPRKIYSALRLCSSFSDCLERFTKRISTEFTDSQTENTRRRSSLFLKFLQHTGKKKIGDLAYEDLYTYHSVELKHLSPNSRIIEESGIYHFLRFLNEEKLTHDIYSQYMYELETGTFIDIRSFTGQEQEELHRRTQKSFPLPEFRKIKALLIAESEKTGYVQDYLDTMVRTIRKLELFLDIYELDYSPNLANVWLNGTHTKAVLGTSSWITARRVIFLLNTFISTGTFEFAKTMPRSISGMASLPSWMIKPLMDYADLRAKEKVDDDTVKNDIYSILRFLRYLKQNNLTSFTEITAESLVAFNLCDEHKSSEGKNACNARIRRFFRYLFRQGIVNNPHLNQALSYAAAKRETVVTALEPAEKETIHHYITNAVTPLQLQDSAIMLLGTEMGIRDATSYACAFQISILRTKLFVLHRTRPMLKLNLQCRCLSGMPYISI